MMVGGFLVVLGFEVEMFLIRWHPHQVGPTDRDVRFRTFCRFHQFPVCALPLWTVSLQSAFEAHQHNLEVGFAEVWPAIDLIAQAIQAHLAGVEGGVAVTWSRDIHPLMVAGSSVAAELRIHPSDSPCQFLAKACPSEQQPHIVVETSIRQLLEQAS